jgi:predicted MFS family arabinose efflux permease
MTKFSIWPIFILVFVISYLEGWAFPASKALIPRLVSNEELVKANSFLSILNQFVQLGGWACGGILAAVLHSENLVWLTFILYILSTLVLSCISDNTEVIDKKIGNLEKEPISIINSIKEGWTFIWKSPILRLIHIILSFESMAYVVWIAAIIYVYVKEQLKMDESWWGYINASFLFGLLIGGFFSLRSSNLIERNMGRIIISSAIGISLTTFLFGFSEIPIFSLVISAIFGVIEQLKGISLQTLLQKSTANDMLPKVYAAQSSLTSICFGVSSLIFGVITQQFGVKVTFIVSTIVLIISACYTIYSRKYLSSKINIHQSQ